MALTIDRPTSMTTGHLVSPWFAQDEQTRTWVGAPIGPPAPTRPEVLNYTQRRLADLRRLPRGWDGGRGLPLRAEIATVALGLVGRITTDDGLATPQFSPLSDGGVYITWLVGGDRLSISMDSDDFSIRAVWRDGNEEFCHEWERGTCSSSRLKTELERAINDAQIFLEKISTHVQHQLLMP